MIRGLATISAALLVLAAPAWGGPGPDADRQALKAAIDDIIARSNLGRGRVSVQVVSLDDGSVVYGRNADDLLNPASNVKLFTSAAALVKLGSEYRFDTEFLLDKQPEDAKTPPRPGEFKGNLYVRGKGDPTILSEKLWGIANRLYLQGLRSISGDLVLDDTYFDAQRVGPGFDQERSDRAYMAPSSAISLNWNTIGVHVSPGDKPGDKARVEVSPPSDYFVIENLTQTTTPRGLRRLEIASVAMGDKQRIVVSGRVPVGQAPVAVWKKIDHPTMYFGQSLKTFLAQQGIKVKGKVRVGTVPTDATVYLLHQSDTLDLVLKKVNKNSSNFTTEQLVKTLGAQFAGVPGSWPNGIRVIEDFLASDVGIPRGTYVMKNGSGLNDTNRFSAAQVCAVLKHMYLRFPLEPEFLSSMGIAGKDGTLAFRMEGTDAVGRLRAKTGTLENVSALSGYVQAVGGEKFAFSILANDFPGRTGPIVAGLDAVGAALASVGSPGGPAAGVAQALDETTAPAPAAELKARIATYQALAKAHDPRNVTFLRTALKATRDPAVKAVVADAIYRSDPEGASGVRALLDHFKPGPDVFGRLREVGRDLSAPTPVLGSITSIAAEGNTEALSLLIEVAAVARSDEALRGELVDPFAEVARNAPDELLAALRSASAATQEAALELLAVTLAKDEEADHPFPAALKRAQASVDPKLVEFARQLDETLAARVAAAKAPKADPAAAPAAASPDAVPTKPTELGSKG